MAKPQKIKTIAKISVPILKKNGVVKAGIFGSAARKKLKKTSDIDFLIKFKRGKSLLDLVRLKHRLEDKLKREVDLVTYGSIHPLLKERIMNEEIKIL
jgi:predicted nucleotidyltransferase